jgi:hypothetical protein
LKIYAVQRPKYNEDHYKTLYSLNKQSIFLDFFMCMFYPHMVICEHFSPGGSIYPYLKPGRYTREEEQ